MAVIREGLEATQKVDYDDAGIRARRRRRRRGERPQRGDLGRRCAARPARRPAPASSTATTTTTWSPAPFRDGTIAEAPVLPGTGLFMPAGSAAVQGQGPVPPQRAGVHRRPVHRLHGMRAGLPGRRDPEHGARHPRPAADRDPPARHRRGAARSDARPGPCAQRRGARDLSAEQGAASRSTRSWRRRRRRSTSTTPRCARNLGKLAQCAGGLSRSPRRGRSSTPWRRPRPAAAASTRSPSIRGSAPAASNASTSAAPHALVEREQDAALLETLQDALRIPEPHCRTRRRASSKARPSPTATPSG